MMKPLLEVPRSQRMLASARRAFERLTRLPSSVSSVLLGLTILLSRLGFVAPGYGTDPDAHRLAIAAAQIRQTGRYVLSREPGHPVQELSCALLSPWGPWGLNTATALMSAVAVVLFAKCLRLLDVRFAGFIALAFGCSPLFFVHSVDSMDYVWAIAFAWCAVYCSLRGWALGAGVALGLSIGCRVTEVFSVFPLLLLLGLRGDGTAKKSLNLRGALALSVPALLVGIGAYWPVFIRYGWTALRVFDDVRTELSVVFRRGFVEPWGILGSFALLALTSFAVITRVKQGRGASVTATGRVLAAAVLGVVFPYLTFLRLPHDAGYVLPAIPWGILAIAVVSRGAEFLFLPTALALGSVPLPFLGESPVWAAHQARVAQVEEVGSLIDQLRAIQRPSVAVVGTYQPKILSALGNEALPFVEVLYLLSRERAEELKARGISIYYHRRTVTFNLRVHQLDLRRAGAKPL